MDKQLMKYLAILGGIVFLLIIVLLLKNAFSGGTKLSYEKIEDKMVSAAKKYAKDKNVLPTEVDSPTSISANVLVNNGYMNDLSSYAKDDVRCSGEVIIYKAYENTYNYVPILNCGNKHESRTLSSIIIEENETTEGSGLYQRVDGKFVTNVNDLNMGTSSDFEYVFRGDDVNNFVKIDDNLWRIVAIDNSENIMLIFSGSLKGSYAWDAKYNNDTNKFQGINTYEANGLQSDIYAVIQPIYSGDSSDIKLMDKEKFSEKTKYLMTSMDLCIGKRSTTDSDISGKTECKTILYDQHVGLLPAYYYMSASLDPLCTSIVSKNCGNYNYLSDFDDYWWLLTANSENTSEAFTVSRKYAENFYCNYKANVRPIIKIGSRAVYSSGDGSMGNPYTIKFYSN